MQTKFFSIVMVSLNAGKKVKETLDSILCQTFPDYEVIIKDGGSKDGSLDFLEEEDILKEYPRVRLIREQDKSIYEGMNQALAYTSGQYVQFLNCGDLFYDKEVLQKVWDFIRKDEKKKDPGPAIYYGNQYNLIQKTVVTSAPVMNDFACFRNVPCHQVCFYDSGLFATRAYLPEYSVRADYEHFLYSIYERKAGTKAMPIIICSYEGGGYSETKENRQKSADQHKEITDRYLGKKAVAYRMIMVLTLSGLRTKIAKSPVLSKPYNAVKSMLYGR